jgi:hypothetical protein
LCDNKTRLEQQVVARALMMTEDALVCCDFRISVAWLTRFCFVLFAN